MSYEARIDEMVGEQVKYFQDEITLAKIMEAYAKKTPAMPCGYPRAVYHPHHTCRTPEVKAFVPRSRGRLTNGVPKVLAMEIVNQYVLGLYNPQRAYRSQPERKARLGSARFPKIRRVFALMQSA